MTATASVGGLQSPVAVPGTTAVGQTSASMMVAVAITGSGVAQAPQVVTQGIAGVDFAVVGGSCAAGASYSPGQNCTVAVTFAPKSPGIRHGAVVLTDGNGGLLGSTLLVGNALGSLGVLKPGRIDTVAGNGAWTFHGDGVLATQAPIFLPTAVFVDAVGNLFLSDSSNNRIRRVDAVTGAIFTVVGNGIPAFSGDGGPATQASINTPSGLTMDGAGNIFFADTNSNAVRRVDAVSGVITTVAGTSGVEGYTGDGGAATAGKLSLPQGLAFDAAGNLYIGDTDNNVVRKVDAATGQISTYAGTGTAGYNGDGLAATSALLNSPWGLSVGVDGALYIADMGNNRIRRVDTSGIISTVAGNGARLFGGDGGPATLAQLNAPAAITFDPAGNLYIADTGNNRVRKVTVSTGFIDTIAGTGLETFSGDTGPADNAGIYGPYALFFDTQGNLFVADLFHNRVRRISATSIAFKFAAIRVTKISDPQPESFENDGNADLLLAAPALVEAALDPVTTTCAAGTMVPDAICKLGVEFAPTVVGNTVRGSVTLNSNAGNSPAIISLAGPSLTVEPTVTALVSSANPALLNASVTFTATVTSLDLHRGGPVTFFDGATVLCNAVPLDAAGVAICVTAGLSLGSHVVVASYAGDPNNAASDSVVLTEVVQQTALVALTATPNPAIAKSTVLLTVAASAVSGVPTGSVTFYDGATVLGSANLTAGAASVSTTQLSAGTHSLSAQYAGDASNAPSTSNVVSEVVSLATTLTTLATSNAAVNYGIAVTFTANVVSSNGPAPTGTMQFVEGTTLLGTGIVNGSGVATLTLATLNPGSHLVSGSYVGDLDNAASASTALLETIHQIPTATVLTSSTAAASAGSAIVFTATVSAAAGATANGAVTGQVIFKNGATVLGTAAVGASGLATLSVSALPVGSAAATASYTGDSSYVASDSAALAESISFALSAFGQRTGAFGPDHAA